MCRLIADVPRTIVCLLTSALLLAACSSEQDTSDRTSDGGAPETAPPDSPTLPSLRLLVAEALHNNAELATPAEIADAREIAYEEVFVLLGALKELEKELAAATEEATNLPKGEFEKTETWETRKSAAVRKVKNQYKARMAGLCGADSLSDTTIRTSAAVAIDGFGYNADSERIMLSTEPWVSEDEVHKFNEYVEVRTTMYDEVGVRRKGPHEMRSMVGRSTSGDRSREEFHFFLGGPGVSPEQAPLLKALVENGRVNAEIELSLNYENGSVTCDVSAVSFKRSNGESIIEWGSKIVVAQKNFSTAEFREIIVTRNLEALKQ